MSLLIPTWPLSRHPLARMAIVKRTSAALANGHQGRIGCNKAQVPSGVAVKIATQIGKTMGRSARRTASGNSWKTAGNPTRCSPRLRRVGRAQAEYGHRNQRYAEANKAAEQTSNCYRNEDYDNPGVDRDCQQF